MGAFSWLFGGNDHELARTQYADRESATKRAARKEAEASERRRQRHRNSVFRNGDKAATKTPRRYGRNGAIG
jgi:hypothetical protein